MALRKFDLSKKGTDWTLVDRKTKKIIKKVWPIKTKWIQKASKIVKKEGWGSLTIFNTIKKGISEERTYPRNKDPKKSKG